MSISPAALKIAYQTARTQAEQAAGGSDGLVQRAAHYRKMFDHSRGNFVFPLIAAHGALWGHGYFAIGLKIGWILSLAGLHDRDARRRRLASLDAFAGEFRAINRQVFVEVHAAYAFTRRHGDEPGAGEFVDAPLLAALNACHAARRSGVLLSRPERAALFEAFFRWEQRVVVSPRVEAATAAFDWAFVRTLALRPAIRFAYIPRGQTLRFKDFANADERIEMGLRAYDIAERIGLDRVATALNAYRLREAVLRDLMAGACSLIRRQGAAFWVPSAAA